MMTIFVIAVLLLIFFGAGTAKSFLMFFVWLFLIALVGGFLFVILA